MSALRPKARGKKRRAASKDDEYPTFSFYHYAKIGGFSRAAMARLAAYSTQDDVHGRELCDFFARTMQYAKLFKRVEAAKKAKSASTVTEKEEPGDVITTLSSASPNPAAPLSSSPSLASSSSPATATEGSATPEEQSPGDASSRDAADGAAADVAAAPRAAPPAANADPATPNTTQLGGASQQYRPSQPCVTLRFVSDSDDQEQPPAAVFPVLQPPPSIFSFSLPPPPPSLLFPFSTQQPSEADNFQRVCSFCSSMVHSSEHCPLFATWKARQDRVKELKLCEHCLIEYSVEFCSGPTHKKPCKICGLHLSHAALCLQLTRS